MVRLSDVFLAPVHYQARDLVYISTHTHTHLSVVPHSGQRLLCVPVCSESVCMLVCVCVSSVSTCTAPECVCSGQPHLAGALVPWRAVGQHHLQVLLLGQPLEAPGPPLPRLSLTGLLGVQLPAGTHTARGQRRGPGARGPSHSTARAQREPSCLVNTVSTNQRDRGHLSIGDTRGQL